MSLHRRAFLSTAVARPVAAAAPSRAAAAPRRRPNRIGVSTYSFWQFRHAALRDIGTCIDLAAELGFDGVEVLHRQMTDESNAALQRIKQRAFRNGLDLMGFSTH